MKLMLGLQKQTTSLLSKSRTLHARDLQIDQKEKLQRVLDKIQKQKQDVINKSYRRRMKSSLFMKLKSGYFLRKLIEWIVSLFKKSGNKIISYEHQKFRNLRKILN